MSELDRTSWDFFESLRKRAIEEAEQGQLDQALATCDQALLWAREFGHRDGEDLILCNRAAVLVSQGCGDQVTGELRHILLRSSDAKNRYLAAYNISRHYDNLEDYSKSHFYAHLALDHARKTDCSEFLAHAHNQLANVLVAESYFREALQEYEVALQHVSPETSIDRALILVNLGYCHLVEESYDVGFRSVFRGFRMIRRLRAKNWEVWSRVRLSLCFGYLEIGRFERAREHGRAALRGAEEFAEEECIKKALYLLGEAEKLAGNEFAAYRHFRRLQSQFYPDNPDLSDLLMATGTYKLINIMA